MDLICNTCYQPIMTENLFCVHDSCHTALVQDCQELRKENDRLRELNQEIIRSIKTNS